MPFIVSLLLFLSVFFLRALPRLCVNKGKLFLETSDTWYHLMLAEEIRQNNHKLPGRISRFLLSESITYPPLLHFFLSYLSKRQRTSVEPFLGGFFDGLAGVCLFFAGREMAGLNMSNAVFAALLFVFSPYALGLSFGPRAALGTPRIFGQLLFFLTVLMLLQYLQTGSYFYGLAATGLGSLIFLASMFSSQAYVFILVVWSLLLPSVEPLMILCGSYVLSLFFSRGHTWRITVGHILHLRIMAKTFWKGRFLSHHIQQRNRVIDILQLPKHLLTDLKQAFFMFYVRNTFLIVLFQIPVVAFYFYVHYCSVPVLEASRIHLWHTLIIAAVVVFIAVSLRPLLFLGESERYMEHIAPFCCIFLVAMLPAGGFWPIGFGVIFYSICLYLVNVGIFVFQLRTKNSIERQRNTQSVLDWIERHASQKRFAVLPQTGLNILVAYLTSGSVLFGRWKDDCSPAVKSLKAVESDEFRKYRSALFQTYAIDYVIIPSTEPIHRNLLELKSEFPVVFQNSQFCILSRSGVERRE